MKVTMTMKEYMTLKEGADYYNSLLCRIEGQISSLYRHAPADPFWSRRDNIKQEIFNLIDEEIFINYLISKNK